MNDFILQTAGLTKKYKTGLALSGVNMSIRKGDIYGFIGRNGAGKTTLVRTVTGLVHPTSGEVRLWGKSDELSLLENRKRIGSIIEVPAYYPNMTAVQNLEIIRLQRGVPGKECIGRALALVGLADEHKKKVKNFSLGMKQRLALAMALLTDPEFLILDEPVNGLDPVGIVEMRELLKRLNREKGMTILVSSHILGELYQLAACYGIINKGELVEELRAAELNKKCRKYLNIRVDDPARAVTILEKELFSTNYEVMPDKCIHLYDYIDVSGKVNSLLSSRQILVESIAPVGEDLEDYFLKVTGGRKDA